MILQGPHQALQADREGRRTGAPCRPQYVDLNSGPSTSWSGSRKTSRSRTETSSLGGPGPLHPEEPPSAQGCPCSTTAAPGTTLHPGRVPQRFAPPPFSKAVARHCIIQDRQRETPLASVVGDPPWPQPVEFGTLCSQGDSW
ncbi:unnamed protein product [Boreogadus saida]